MLKINFQNLPAGVKVLWIVALLASVAGLVLLVMNIFEIGNIRLAIPMACVVVGQLINIVVMQKYREEKGA